MEYIILTQLSESEKKVRKRWLLLTLCLAAFIVFIQVAGILTLEISYQRLDIGFTFVYLLAKESIVCLAPYVLYRCAYKKPGIHSLTFTILLSPLLAPWAYGSFSSFFFLYLNGFGAAFFIILFSLGAAWWYYLTFKLRGVNKKLQLYTQPTHVKKT